MKTGNKVLLAAITAGLLMITTGCASHGYSYYTSEIAREFPNTKPEQVKIIKEIPTKKYLQLGYVYSPPGTKSEYDEQIAEMRRLASRMGADGLIHLKEEEGDHYTYQKDESTPFWSFKNTKVKQYVLKATAIKWIK